MAKKKPVKHKLNRRQSLFVRYYVSSGMNSASAAEKAGYSPKTARAQGCRLLSNVYIKVALDKHIHDLLTDTENLSIKWLQQTMAIAGFDIRKAVSWDKGGVEFIDSSTPTTPDSYLWLTRPPDDRITKGLKLRRDPFPILLFH